tara:strand:+ start:1459 stop:1872 length:414 start_codon:yes stop_codon:yes gene_type:complete
MCAGAETPLHHPRTGTSKAWYEAQDLEGAFDMSRLAQLFESIAWWSLRPDPELLRTQPGEGDPHTYVGAVRSDSGGLALLYLPCDGEVGLAMDRIELVDTFRWYDPRSGAYRDASHDDGQFTAPDGQDWILLLTKGS